MASLVTNFPPRDLVGYAGKPPHPQWPGKGRIAVQFVLNYEEGGENCILDGDKTTEWLLSDIIGAQPKPGIRDPNMESLYEYGSRAGFWRLHRMFTERKMPLTVFAVALALEKNPEAAKAMKEADWEIASHGLRWIDYQYMQEDEEREHIRKCVEIQTRVTGERPFGLYQGKPNINTRKLTVEEGGFIYDSDYYGDDLPLWNYNYGRPHLVIPYTLECNDMRFAVANGFNSGEQFFTYLKDTFDFLYEEGKDAPKMMSIGLHCRLAGKPGRAAALARFLDYIQSKEDVWVCRRIDIARHWYKNFYPEGYSKPNSPALKDIFGPELIEEIEVETVKSASSSVDVSPPMPDEQPVRMPSPAPPGVTPIGS